MSAPIDARGATAVAIADGVRAGKWLRARRRRAVPRSHRAPRRRARLLPAGRRRRRAPARRRGRRRPQGGTRSGRARGRSAGREGHLLHARRRDDVRVEDPARFRPALRIDGDGASRGGGRRDAGQAEHGRVRDGLVEREQRVQAGAQPVVARARARRIVGRLGGGDRGVAVRGRRSAPTRADRSGSRPRCAASSAIKPTYGRVSRYGVIAFASSLDHPGPFGRTVEDAAALLEVMAGADAHDATSIPTPVGQYRAAARAGRDGPEPLKGDPARRSRRILPARHGRRGRGRGARGDRRARARGRAHRQGVAAQHEVRDRDLLPRLHRGGVVEPGALRRRSSRLSRAGRALAGGDVHEDARRRIRHRAEAPDHAGHVRAARRLLRGVLRQGAARAAQDRRRFHGGVRERATRSSRRRRRCRRSSSASAWAIRCRCTSPTC